MIYDNVDLFPISQARGSSIYIVRGYGSKSLRKLKKIIMKVEESKELEGTDNIVLDEREDEGLEVGISDYYVSEIKLGKFNSYYFSTPYVDVQGVSGKVFPYLAILPLQDILSMSKKDDVVVVVDLPLEDEKKESPFGIWSSFYKGDLVDVAVHPLRGVGLKDEDFIEWGRNTVYPRVKLLTDPLAKFREIVVRRGSDGVHFESGEFVSIEELERRKIIGAVTNLAIAFTIFLAGKSSIDFTLTFMEVVKVKNEYFSLKTELSEKQGEERRLRDTIGNYNFIPYYLNGKSLLEFVKNIPSTCHITSEQPDYYVVPYPGCIKDLKNSKVQYQIDHVNRIIKILR